MSSNDKVSDKVKFDLNISFEADLIVYPKTGRAVLSLETVPRYKLNSLEKKIKAQMLEQLAKHIDGMHSILADEAEDLEVTKGQLICIPNEFKYNPV